MTYVDKANPPYPKETIFPPERLRQLTPEMILEWMNTRIFDGVANPAADANPIVRNNTVKVWKKAISSFMPDQNEWNENNRSGNPTKSKPINDLLHRIHRQETRRQGAPPQKRRSLEPQSQQQGEEEQQHFQLQVDGHLDSQTPVQLLLHVINQLGSLQGEIAGVRQDLAALNEVMMAQFAIVNTNLGLVAGQPIHQLNPAAAPQQTNTNQNGGSGVAINPLVHTAELSPTPKNIYVLWEEWMSGIGGRKAARLFSSQERGRVKHKFCRRKVVWDLIARLVRSGFTAQVACDRIVAVYGQSTTVTNIIARLRNDIRAKRLHPTLTV